MAGKSAPAADLTGVAPELRSAAAKLPRVPYDSKIARLLIRTLLRFMRAPKVDGVAIETCRAIKPALRVYRPSARKSDAALLWIHGGGFLIGNAKVDDRFCATTARDLGIVVVSANYRLAPEHPFPAALDDCHAAWTWLQRSAGELGIDPTRIVVGGQSAGGALAATLVQRLHDEGGPSALAQWLFAPMLDDRTAARRELDAIEHPAWTNRQNAFAWSSFLGAEPGCADLPRYAAAARRDDLRGLPPAWIGVGEIDLFHSEDQTYAERLRDAGVEVTWESVPGAPHGFETWASDTRISENYVTAGRDWLRRVLSRDGAQQSGARR